MTVLSDKDYEKIIELLEGKKYSLKNGWCFETGDGLYRISLVKDLGGYVIEYAESKDDAINNLFEDLETVSFDKTKEEIVNDVVAYIKSLSDND